MSAVLFQEAVGHVADAVDGMAHYDALLFGELLHVFKRGIQGEYGRADIMRHLGGHTYHRVYDRFFLDELYMGQVFTSELVHFIYIQRNIRVEALT